MIDNPKRIQQMNDFDQIVTKYLKLLQQGVLTQEQFDKDLEWLYENQEFIEQIEKLEQ